MCSIFFNHKLYPRVLFLNAAIRFYVLIFILHKIKGCSKVSRLNPSISYQGKRNFQKIDFYHRYGKRFCPSLCKISDKQHPPEITNVRGQLPLFEKRIESHRTEENCLKSFYREWLIHSPSKHGKRREVKEALMHRMASFIPTLILHYEAKGKRGPPQYSISFNFCHICEFIFVSMHRQL